MGGGLGVPLTHLRGLGGQRGMGEGIPGPETLQARGRGGEGGGITLKGAA